MRADRYLRQLWSQLPASVLTDPGFGRNGEPGVHVRRRLLPKIFAPEIVSDIRYDRGLSEQRAAQMKREWDAAVPRLVRANAAFRDLRAANRVHPNRIANAADPLTAGCWLITEHGAHTEQEIVMFYSRRNSREYRPATAESLRAYIAVPSNAHRETQRLRLGFEEARGYVTGARPSTTRRGGRQTSVEKSATMQHARTVLDRIPAPADDDWAEAQAAWLDLTNAADLDSAGTPKELHLSDFQPPRQPAVVDPAVDTDGTPPLDWPILDRLLQAIQNGDGPRVALDARDTWQIGVDAAIAPYGLITAPDRAALRLGTLTLAATSSRDGDAIPAAADRFRRRWRAAVRAVNDHQGRTDIRTGHPTVVRMEEWMLARLWVRLHRRSFLPAEPNGTWGLREVWYLLFGLIESAAKRLNERTLKEGYVRAIGAESDAFDDLPADERAAEVGRLTEENLRAVTNPRTVIGYVLAAALEEDVGANVRVFIETVVSPEEPNRPELSKTWAGWTSSFDEKWGYALPTRNNGERAISLPSYELARMVIQARLKRVLPNEAEGRPPGAGVGEQSSINPEGAA